MDVGEMVRSVLIGVLVAAVFGLSNAIKSLKCRVELLETKPVVDDDDADEGDYWKPQGWRPSSSE